MNIQFVDSVTFQTARLDQTSTLLVAFLCKNTSFNTMMQANFQNINHFIQKQFHDIDLLTRNMALKFTDGCSTKVKFQFGIGMHGRMSHKRYILNPTTLRIITVVESKFLWHDVHKNGKGFCPTLLSRILFSLKRSDFSQFECS